MSNQQFKSFLKIAAQLRMPNQVHYIKTFIHHKGCENHSFLVNYLSCTLCLCGLSIYIRWIFLNPELKAMNSFPNITKCHNWRKLHLPKQPSPIFTFKTQSTNQHKQCIILEPRRPDDWEKQTNLLSSKEEAKCAMLFSMRCVKKIEIGSASKITSCNCLTNHINGPDL